MISWATLILGLSAAGLNQWFALVSAMMNIVEHLKSRHVDFNLHRPIIDEENGVATFLLYNLSGQIVGYQRYNPNGEKKPSNNPKMGRYFTYKRHPTITVFGVETLHLSPNVVFLTEGIFDAVRITELGFSALAALSNDPVPDLKNFLTCLGRRVVVIADNDKAGRKLAKFGHQVVYCEDKDLGDSSEEFVREVVHNHTRM